MAPEPPEATQPAPALTAPVVLDEAKGIYRLDLPGGKARLEFTKAGEHTLEFRHTEVARELRGQGVGEALVRGALDDARARGYRVIATCPFVRRFVERHPEYRDLTTISA